MPAEATQLFATSAHDVQMIPWSAFQDVASADGHVGHTTHLRYAPVEKCPLTATLRLLGDNMMVAQRSGELAMVQLCLPRAASAHLLI